MLRIILTKHMMLSVENNTDQVQQVENNNDPICDIENKHDPTHDVETILDPIHDIDDIPDPESVDQPVENAVDGCVLGVADCARITIKNGSFVSVGVLGLLTRTQHTCNIQSLLVGRQPPISTLFHSKGNSDKLHQISKYRTVQIP